MLNRFSAVAVAALAWLDAIPGLRGITPRVLVDFRSPCRPHPYFQDFWNRKGLISQTGMRKQAFIR